MSFKVPIPPNAQRLKRSCQVCRAARAQRDTRDTGEDATHGRNVAHRGRGERREGCAGEHKNKLKKRVAGCLVFHSQTSNTARVGLRRTRDLLARKESILDPQKLRSPFSFCCFKPEEGARGEPVGGMLTQ
ncbi:hypothetical protein BaRGS_00007765 [Batillaria attramentaria]|uniref:Uncharacterized protein n=1 Tax=Batillaria attramentaria TaxID=370345 RepID=A0ABD0LN00_9CAEN